MTGLAVKKPYDPSWASTTAPCHQGASIRYEPSCQFQAFMIDEEFSFFFSELHSDSQKFFMKQKNQKMTFNVFQAPINFSNSEFYGFSEFFYCTEDVLRLGGQYDSEKYSRAAMVSRHTPPSLSRVTWIKNMFVEGLPVVFVLVFLQDYCSTKWSTLKQRLDNKLFSQQADISRLR